ncbi:MAG: carboxypeptidase regulatory-like domain-containing protein [Anaerolineales bacterium]|nr:carboxypeptidase regulatory-like domain-containing protein [Anaerolineales bacterium]
MPQFRLRWIIALVVLLVAVLLFWLVTTDSASVWPYRNTLQYHALSWWWQQTGYPQPGEPGELRGVVLDMQSQPIAGAWVLVSRWDGTTYSTRSEADGGYRITNVPTGQYRPVAGAPGFDSVEAVGWVTINPETTTTADIILPPEPARSLTPGQNLSFAAPSTPACADPLPATANRQPFTFDNNGKPGQPALYYTPLTTTTTSRLPVLMVVYPGPAASWDCASLPLAAAGYAVVALGPAYSLDLEADIDELERVVAFIRAGQFPRQRRRPAGGSGRQLQRPAGTAFAPAQPPL